MTVEQLLHQIASDKRSGAAEILGRAAELFESLAAEPGSPSSTGDAHRVTIETCRDLVRAQPCMAPLINLASEVVRRALAADAAEVFKVAAGAASEFKERCLRAAAAASAHAAAIIAAGTDVVTHSRSSTVVNALIGAHSSGREFRVIATESRPLLEGRTLAAELASRGIGVTLIADAAAATVIEDAGCVLIGADLVTPTALVNKVGTRLIAIAARQMGIPVYAIGDASKFINLADSQIPIEAAREANEVWDAAPPGVVILNRYFERTPLSLFTRVVTEDGLLTPGDAAQRAEGALIEPALVEALRAAHRAED